VCYMLGMLVIIGCKSVIINTSSYTKQEKSDLTFSTFIQHKWFIKHLILYHLKYSYL